MKENVIPFEVQINKLFARKDFQEKALKKTICWTSAFSWSVCIHTLPPVKMRTATSPAIRSM